MICRIITILFIRRNLLQTKCIGKLCTICNASSKGSRNKKALFYVVGDRIRFYFFLNLQFFLNSRKNVLHLHVFHEPSSQMPLLNDST